MVVLGDKEVEIITPEGMLRKFGDNVLCTWKDGVLYINQKILETEKRRFEGILSETEVVEDIYMNARKINTGKIKKKYPTVWNELLRRHIDPKYRREPLNV